MIKKLGKKALLLILVAVLLFSMAVGCSKAETDPESTDGESVGEDGTEVSESGYDSTSEVPSVESGVIANSANLSLVWDCEASCMMLLDNRNGAIWSSIPYGFYSTHDYEDTDDDLNSPIFVEYVAKASKTTDMIKGYRGCLRGGRVGSTKIDDGMEVTYYFDEYEMSIPVQYVLRDDSLAISVDFSRAEEHDYQILSVSLAPFICSVPDNAQDAYLVVPSGSGALMYPYEAKEGRRTYSGELYGADAARQLPEYPINSETVRLPIFGVKDGAKALMGIVEEGSEHATIEAQAGDPLIGYSSAYVTFSARGYDKFESQVTWDYRDLYYISDDMVPGKMTVGLYPLTENDASYVGMANRYRQYLIDNNGLEKTDRESPYSLYISGGVETKSLFFGVPYYSTKKMTDFQQALTIISELKDKTGVSPLVQLLGFGKSGLNPGAVAGGFSFASVLGSAKDQAALESYAKESGISLFTDFDLINFSSSGSGYLTLTDVAKSPSLHKATKYYIDKSLQSNDKDIGSYYLLKRTKTESTLNKVLKFASSKKLSGISLDTLGSIAYSDYTKEQYANKGNMAADVIAYIRKIQESGLPVSVSSANAYAAATADYVLKTPMTSGDYDSLDADIPLYQMIFKGYCPLYSTALNGKANNDQEIMLAVQSGTSLGFSLIGEYDVSYARSPFAGLNTSLYEGNRQWIVDTVSQHASYYDAIKGAVITNYEFLENDVTRTTFDNGVIVYANHSTKTVDTPEGTLKAYGVSYHLGGEG